MARSVRASACVEGAVRGRSVTSDMENPSSGKCRSSLCRRPPKEHHNVAGPCTATLDPDQESGCRRHFDAYQHGDAGSCQSAVNSRADEEDRTACGRRISRWTLERKATIADQPVQFRRHRRRRRRHGACRRPRCGGGAEVGDRQQPTDRCACRQSRRFPQHSRLSEEHVSSPEGRFSQRPRTSRQGSWCR